MNNGIASYKHMRLGGRNFLLFSLAVCRIYAIFAITKSNITRSKSLK